MHIDLYTWTNEDNDVWNSVVDNSNHWFDASIMVDGLICNTVFDDDDTFCEWEIHFGSISDTQGIGMLNDVYLDASAFDSDGRRATTLPNQMLKWLWRNIR